jgi:protein-tyrosine-phosphatase
VWQQLMAIGRLMKSAVKISNVGVEQQQQQQVHNQQQQVLNQQQQIHNQQQQQQLSSGEDLNSDTQWFA